MNATLGCPANSNSADLPLAAQSVCRRLAMDRQVARGRPGVAGQTLFGLLCERQPGRYQEGQLRTLQRHIASWRAQYGPNREVMFAQVHEPGEAAQSDFTYMNSLGVTLGGVSFPHLVYHLVLVYSNIEAVQICFSESFESLVEGSRRACGK